MNASEPGPTAELVKLLDQFSNHKVTVDDVVRAWEIVYGQPPDMTRPLSDLADEIMAAVAWMSPAATKERQVGQRVVTEATAADGRAMTVDELRAFLDRIDPAGSGTSATLAPKVRLSWGGGIKKITVEEQR